MSFQIPLLCPLGSCIMALLPFSATEICGSIRNVTFHVFLLKMFIDSAKVESALKLRLTGCSVWFCLAINKARVIYLRRYVLVD